MDLNPSIGIPADPVANEYRLRHVGRISYSAFQVSSTMLMRMKAFVGFELAA